MRLTRRSALPFVEILGHDALETSPACRAGALTFLFELCRERAEVRGLFGKVLAGDGGYVAP